MLCYASYTMNSIYIHIYIYYIVFGVNSHLRVNNGIMVYNYDGINFICYAIYHIFLATYNTTHL